MMSEEEEIKDGDDTITDDTITDDTIMFCRHRQARKSPTFCNYLDKLDE